MFPVVNAIKHEIERIKLSDRLSEEDKAWQIELLKRYLALFERITIISPNMLGASEREYNKKLEECEYIMLVSKDDVELYEKAVKIIDLLKE